MPTIYLFPACCARASSDHAAAAPPSSDMNSRLFTRSPRRRGREPGWEWTMGPGTGSGRGGNERDDGAGGGTAEYAAGGDGEALGHRIEATAGVGLNDFVEERRAILVPTFLWARRISSHRSGKTCYPTVGRCRWILSSIPLTACYRHSAVEPSFSRRIARTRQVV